MYFGILRGGVLYTSSCLHHPLPSQNNDLYLLGGGFPGGGDLTPLSPLQFFRIMISICSAVDSLAVATSLHCRRCNVTNADGEPWQCMAKLPQSLLADATIVGPRGNTSPEISVPAPPRWPIGPLCWWPTGRSNGEAPVMIPYATAEQGSESAK